MTRIWCAKYLKAKIKASRTLKSKYDVQDYIIVLNEPNQIKINFNRYFDVTFPIIEICGANIYFKEIKGSNADYSLDEMFINDIGIGDDIGFMDLGDGNIILFILFFII